MKEGIFNAALLLPLVLVLPLVLLLLLPLLEKEDVANTDFWCEQPFLLVTPLPTTA